MATIFYIRERSKQGNISSSREVSVEDLISLYGSESSNYSFLKGLKSPDISSEKKTTDPDADPAHVIVKIEGDEVSKNIFPAEGFYLVRDVKP